MLEMIKDMLELTKDGPHNTFLDTPEIFILLHGFVKVNFDWAFQRNSPFWMLYWNRTSGATLKFKDKTINLDSKQILLIPPNTAFTTTKYCLFEHLYIHFRIDKPFLNVKKEPILLNSQPYLPWLNELEFISIERKSFLLNALILLALTSIPEDNILKEQQNFDIRILKSLPFFSENLTNIQIAHKIGMSLSNFQRLFREEMGLTPKHYSLILRVEHAQQLLLETNFSIEQIADKCGFSDRFSFSKIFKKYKDISPAEFRNKQKYF